ncbi:hypothetical protein D3C80_2237150 [compost metagenome]
MVMMALAGSIHGVSARRVAAASSTPANLLAGRGSPMTPVEARKISLVLQPSALAA